MIYTSILYLKTQYKFIITLTLFIIIPFLLACIYLPKIPYLFYLFMIILVSLKLIVMDEKRFRDNIRPKVIKQLKKKNGKTPSNNEIFKRLKFHIASRDTSLVFIGLSLVFIAIYFNRF